MLGSRNAGAQNGNQGRKCNRSRHPQIKNPPRTAPTIRRLRSNSALAQQVSLDVSRQVLVHPGVAGNRLPIARERVPVNIVSRSVAQQSATDSLPQRIREWGTRHRSPKLAKPAENQVKNRMRPIAMEVLRDFCPRNSFSLAPGFDRVSDALNEWSRFSGFVLGEIAEAVLASRA